MMSRASRLGVYWAPGHNRPADLEYMRALQPAVVRILDPDVAQVSAAHTAAPNALLALRFWLLDDDGFQQQERMQPDPEGFADANATAQIAALENLEKLARERGLSFPSREQILLNALNEPTIWGPERTQRRANANRYNLRFGKHIEAAGCGALLGCINSGQPDDWPPQWDWFGDALAFLAGSSRSLLELHEYWQPEGPNAVWTDEQRRERRDGGALAWRHKHLPAAVRILIGECGCDGVIYSRHAQANRGWRAFMSPEQYAQQLAEYLAGCDSRVVAALPFLTDYRENRANAWDTFDTAPAHDEILARRSAFEVQLPTSGAPTQTPPPVHLPIIENGGSGGATTDDFTRVMSFIHKWEGGFSLDPEDHGNWTGGRKGVGELRGTNFGISAASYPDLDIRNLTQEQADAIYRRDYWLPSGADHLPWPANLLVMDTAILHGVGAATRWLAEVGTDPLAIAAKRLRVYTHADNWQHFGAGWVNRVAALLEASANN
jgi:hypothetical protein